MECHTRKHSAIEREPQAQRRQKYTLPKAIPRLDSHHATLCAQIAAKNQPAELCIFSNIRSCVPRVAKEVRTIVTCIRIEDHLIRIAMEGRRSKPFLINTAKGPHRAAIADPQQVQIGR